MIISRPFAARGRPERSVVQRLVNTSAAPWSISPVESDLALIGLSAELHQEVAPGARVTLPTESATDRFVPPASREKRFSTHQTFSHFGHRKV